MQPDNTLNLDAYFNRIAYGGDATPTLATLRALHLLHPQAIPFENLSPLVGWPVLLDGAALQDKLVQGGRGGYCFEQNLLFSQVLQAIGFRVTGLAARVLWNAPPGRIGPRTHMLLRVEMDDGPWIADVGFGGLTLTAPLTLQACMEQSTPHEPFRLLDADGYYVMQARIQGEWRPLYRFDLQPQFQSDYEVTSWYLSHHPASVFVTGLMAARVAGERRYALRNNDLAVHLPDGNTQRRLVETGAELYAVLERDFKLTLAPVPELLAALDRLAKPA